MSVKVLSSEDLKKMTTTIAYEHVIMNESNAFALLEDGKIGMIEEKRVVETWEDETHFREDTNDIAKFWLKMWERKE